MSVTNKLLAEMFLARQHPPEAGGMPSTIPPRTGPTRGRPFPDWYRALEEQRRQIEFLRWLEQHRPPSFDLPPLDYTPLNTPAPQQPPPDGSPSWLPVVPWPSR